LRDGDEHVLHEIFGRSAVERVDRDAEDQRGKAAMQQSERFCGAPGDLTHQRVVA